MKLSSQHVALMAIFAALYYVLSIFTPYVPAIGIPEIKISLEALFASIFGLILGPYLGAITAFAGAFIAWALPPGSMSPYGAPFLLSPPVNALIVGLIYYKKWKVGFTIFGLLILAFLFLPPSQPLTENYFVGIAVIWDKLIALFLIIPIILITRKSLSKNQAVGFSCVTALLVTAIGSCAPFVGLPFNINVILIFIVLIMWSIFLITLFAVYGAIFDEKAISTTFVYFLLAFVGNQADNMWGSNVFAIPVVYEGIFGLPLEVVRFLFIVSPFVYPAIRLIQASIATIIATPLMKALKRTNWFPKNETIESLN